MEVFVHGDAAAIDDMARWLSQGPPAARVDNVVREPVDARDAPDGFAIG